MQRNEIKRTVEAMVRKLGTVSFAEIRRELGTAVFDGDANICLRQELYAWVHMSHDVALAITELTAPESGPLMYMQCPPMIYMIDGAMLPIPVAKSIRDYKRPRWVPVVLEVRR